MRTNVAETSVDCFYKRLHDGSLTKSEAQVLAGYAAGENFTCRELAKKLNLESSSVSGRINSLLAKRVVVDLGRRVCKVTGESVRMTALPEKQGDLFA
jgi:DNA-binding MarR family transcriptional regulator